MPDRYNQPTQGTTNWHIPLNDNFSSLDIDVEHRGADADKSNVTPADGAKYLATDTATIYVGDGSAWNDIGSIGSGGEAGIGGHHTATGDGTTTTFQWVTGVSDSSNLNYVTIDATTSAASADYERFIDGTDVGVRYADPPADGESLGWYWSVNTSVETVNGEIDAFDGSGTFLGSYSELHTGDNITGTVSNGQLTLNASGGGGHSVSDNGTQEVTGVSDVNFGTDLGVNDDGDGSVTVNSTAAASGSGSHRWIDVTSDTYGADPTGANDSVGAIQQACDDAGAGTVFIPEGDYLIDGEITLTSAHNGLTLVGEGYSSHLQGSGADPANDVTVMIQDSGTPIRHITVKDLRVSNSDYANLHAHWDNHPDSMDIGFQNIWSHGSAGRGLLLASAGAYVDGLRVWNHSHNGLSLSGQIDDANNYLDRWPTDEQWRWANNVFAWNCDSNGIDISKQAGWVTNFFCRYNTAGMKFSNYGHARGLMNGWLMENDHNGMRHTGSNNHQTITMNNVWSLRNGQNVTDTNYGPGRGFDIRNATYRIGHIYAGGNAAEGVMADDGADIVIDQLVSEDNSNAGLYSDAPNRLDVMHYTANGNGGGATSGAGPMWILRGDGPAQM